jgi:branched-chain amino acid transport system permease protein
VTQIIPVRSQLTREWRLFGLIPIWRRARQVSDFRAVELWFVGESFWVGRSSLVEPAIGLQPVLIAFIASVVGGMASLKGAVLGGYLLGFLTVGLQMWLPQEMLNYRNAVLFGIVIVILLVRPEGLIRPVSSRERR